MTPALWTVRAVNLALALAASWFGARDRAVSLLVPGAVAFLLTAADAAAVWSGRPAAPAARRWTFAALTAAGIALVLWLAQWTRQWAGIVDLAVLAPASLLALEFGPLAGAAAAAVPAVFTIFLLSSFGGADASLLPALAVRAGLLALAPFAAGLALGPARASASAATRSTLARLRSAQVGEYLSFALFQLRDYAITVSSLAESIALAPGDPKTPERLERLREAAGELGHKLSATLGDRSALATARPPTSTRIDLVELLEDCAAQARAAFAPDGVTVTILTQSAPPPVASDRRSIELALLAVLQNSLEACAQRGRGAEAERVRAEGGNAEIEISDDGGGLPETTKVAVFEPFISARRGGLGLGLSMSRRFLERIGGGIRIKSKAGYTAVLLVIPLEKEFPKIRLEDSTWAGRRAER